MDHTVRLPDEVMVGIFKHMPILELPRCAMVCQRWRRLAADESLWFEVFLYVGKLSFQALAKIIEHGVRELRLVGEIVGSPERKFRPNYRSPLRSLNMSGTSIMATSMEQILLRTSELVTLRIGLGPMLNTRCFTGIGQNSNLETLDLSNSDRIDASWISHVLKQCKNLKELNFRSTNLKPVALNALIPNLSNSLVDLDLHNVSPHFRDSHLAEVVKRCPNLKRLAIGSNWLLSAKAAEIVWKLEHLEQLENEQNDDHEWEDESSDDEFHTLPHFLDLHDEDEFSLDESDALEQWMMYKDAKERDDGSEIFYLMNLDRIYNGSSSSDDDCL